MRLKGCQGFIYPPKECIDLSKMIEAAAVSPTCKLLVQNDSVGAWRTADSISLRNLHCGVFNQLQIFTC